MLYTILIISFNYFIGNFGVPKQTLIPTEPDDSHVLVNLTNFDYIIGKPRVKIIKDGAAMQLPYLVVLVHSNPYYSENRNAIRDTWGRFDPRVLTYFLLGAVNTSEVQREIEAENRQYNDIIQGNFFDSYYNTTYKHTMALKWFKDHCAGIKYLVKQDEDVFLNVPAAYEFLHANIDDSNFMMGRYGPIKVHRVDHKNPVKREEYAEDTYPPFVYGGYLIYSADLVEALYEKTKTTRFLKNDDVFVTGLCRLQLNNKITSYAKHILFEYPESADAKITRTDFITTVDNISPTIMRIIWDKTEKFRSAHKYVYQ